MALTEITVQAIPGNVAAALAAANADGSWFTAGAPAHRLAIWIKNAAGSPQTITIAGQQADNEGNTNNRAISVPATTGELIIPIRPWEIDPDTGKVSISFSAVVTLTLGVFRTHA